MSQIFGLVQRLRDDRAVPSNPGPLPLAASAPVGAAGWPAAVVAGQLLAALGAPLGALQADAAVARGDAVVAARPATAAQDWADSGAMALTGFADGPSLHSTGAPRWPSSC